MSSSDGSDKIDIIDDNIIWCEPHGGDVESVCAACAATEIERLRADLDALRGKLADHLSPQSDPCQYRGVDWPCAVDLALRDET